MNDRRAKHRDRRQCARYPIAARVSWKQIGRRRTFVGLVTDLSESGLAFVTAEYRELTIGDTLRVSTSCGPGSLHKIARIAPYGARDALIACTPLFEE